jgi:two-component system sensor histidine kinase MtrB
VEAKTRTSLAEARSGVLSLEGDPRLSEEGVVRGAQVSRLEDVFEDIARRGAGSGYRVLLVGTTSTGAFSSGALGTDDVPSALVERLDARPTPAYAFHDVTGDAPDEPSLVVGSPVQVPQLGELGSYRLYHVFPLTAELGTLGLVRRTATLSGLLLVVLLALITGLVARQVVKPVRAAARTAGRLADGRLDERMTVRGEDEIARLGSSFNSMAEALQSQIRQLEDLSRVQRRFVSGRLARAAHPADDRPDGRDVLFDAREDFPRGRRVGRAAAGRARPLRGAAGRPARDQPLRRGAADLDVSPTDLEPLVAGWSRRPSRSPSAGAAASSSACRARRWSPTSSRSHRAGAAQPRRQRRRARRGPAGRDHVDADPTRSS